MLCFPSLAPLLARFPIPTVTGTFVTEFTSGGKGDDLLIGGSTVYQIDLLALAAAMEDWADDDENDGLIGGQGDDELFGGAGDVLRS